MSSQDDIPKAAKEARRNLAVYRAASGGLSDAVDRGGGELLGLSVKMARFDCLVTLRATFPAGRMVAFVGGDSLASCLVKAHNEAKRDGLRWKADKYARRES